MLSCDNRFSGRARAGRALLALAGSPSPSPFGSGVGLAVTIAHAGGGTSTAANVPHYGGLSTHAGYSGSQPTSYFSGASPAENEAFSWLKDEVERLFKNLPSGDGSF